MADKNKLAAGRRMLEEYKKKHRNNNGPINQTSDKPHLPFSSIADISKKCDELPQNHVDDSVTSVTDKSKLETNENIRSHSVQDVNSNYNNDNSNLPPSGVTEINNTSVVEKSARLVNGSDKSDDHYVEQLVTELKTQSQSLITDNGLSVDKRCDDNNVKPDYKSAKDFFDSLPALSQTNADFSFDTQIIANTLTPRTETLSNTTSCATAPISTTSSTVEPLFNQSTGIESFVLKNDDQDDQSDRSESIPATPSEQEKSEDSSLIDHHSKHVSAVLELQLQEIDIKLGTEIDKNKQLQEQLQKSQSNVILLEATLEKVRREKESQENVLEEKLKYHVTTLEILVAEKTELQTALTTCQESISQKAGEMEELQGRLRASRHKVGDLERKLALAQTLQQQHEKSAHEATLASDTLKQEVDLIRKRLEETEEEVLSLKHKVETRNKEVETLQNKLQVTNSQLSVSELRIQQLSSPGDAEGHKLEENMINSLQAEKISLEQQALQLSEELKKVSLQKDEASLQYQQYVANLNAQLLSLSSQYETISNQRDSLSGREASLVEHVSNLEKQLQQMQQRKSTPPLQNSNNELEKISKQLQQVTAEKQQLQDQLEKEVSGKNDIYEVLREKNEHVEELERSLERLEADRPDAGLLQAAIESDKIAASRAMTQNSNLKKQLEELQDAFIKLSNNKLDLTEKLEQEQHLSKELKERLSHVELPVKNESPTKDVQEVPSKPEVKKIDFCSQTYNIKNDEPGLVIDIEAMGKLEDKFKKKMYEVAELSDEKQRLEHLVMQLQGETETIGEYIALYQIQRGMLRQRAQEKDEQMARLAQDREVLRNKLKELNNLVQTMLPNAHLHQCPMMKAPDETVEPEVETANEVVEESPPQQNTVNGVDPEKEETVGKIQALLTEIGSSNLVTPDMENATNFHSCPWCSGRLITI